MAEIPIQEKRGGSKSWLWILALVVLALLAWLFFARDDVDEIDGPVPATETGALTPAPAAVVAPYLAA